MTDIRENVIEWLNGDKMVTATLSQKRLVNRLKRMAEKYPSCVEIVAENIDGSILARFPLSAVHITIYGQKTASFEEVIDDGRPD